MRMRGATGVDYPVVNGKQLGVWAAEGASAATRDKPVSHGTTSCAQGPTLGLSVAPRDPRFSHVSLRCLLPPTLPGAELHAVSASTALRTSAARYQFAWLTVKHDAPTLRI